MSPISSASRAREPRVHEPHLLRLFLADEVLEVPRAVARVEAAHHRADLPKHRAFLGDREVAHDLQHLAAADREPVHGCDHRLLQALDAFVDFQRRQHARIERAVFQAVLAAADAEELVAGAGDDQHARSRLAPDVVDAVADLVTHLRREHVAVVRPIERQPADRAFFSIKYGFVCHCSLRLIGTTEIDPLVRGVHCGFRKRE